ncbi:Ribonuclease 3-like protein 2 [Euphorbia peplus]|nr:Ribonuclease 3-like protein 2 [Euphorbia peplus]
MEQVERILNYCFKNKSLLLEALTHPSIEASASYQRLEFMGDSALGLAFTQHFFLVYQHLDPGRLSLLRAANTSNEKLARAAVFHRLYHFLRHNNVHSLDHMVGEFSDAVRHENNGAAVAHGGSVKAPKVMADLVESLAGAVYVDLNFDLHFFWLVFRRLLEPIVTLEELENNPQPVSYLYELCQKKGKEVDIVNWKKRKTDENIATVYVDGQFVISSSSQNKEIAKLKAAQEAVTKLSHMMQHPDHEHPFCIQNAKHKLDSLCAKHKWPEPTYSIQEMGPPHERKFVCSVQIETREGVLRMFGEEKTRVKAAKTSAASLILRALNHSNHL